MTKKAKTIKLNGFIYSSNAGLCFPHVELPNFPRASALPIVRTMSWCVVQGLSYPCQITLFSGWALPNAQVHTASAALGNQSHSIHGKLLPYHKGK
jgi:hypothetical protein